MAYVPKRQDDDEANRPSGGTDPNRTMDAGADANPYGSLTYGAKEGALANTPGAKVASEGPETLGDSGPSATGYVNFDRIYNANAGVATREAGNRQKAIDAKAKGAQQGLAGAQNTFNSKLTGSSNAAPIRSAGLTGADTLHANKPAPAPPVVDERAALQAGADKKWSGPNSLSALDEYGKLAQDTAAAQDFAKNPLTGMNQTDAALLGAAGRGGFDYRAKRYGDMKGDLAKANAASVDQATAARKQAEAERNQYAQLLSDYDKAHAPDGITPDEQPGGAWHPEGFSDYGSFMNGGNAEDMVNHVGTTISPLDEVWSWLGENGVTHGRGPTDKGNDYFSGQYGTPGAKTESVRDAFGKISHEMGNDAAKYLYDHMTEEMWNEYMQMNAGEAAKAMKEWLASSGYKAPTPGSEGGRASESQQTGSFGGGAAAVAKEQGTTEEDERHRNDIAAGRPYTDANGKTWTSVAEWDAAHRGSA